MKMIGVKIFRELSCLMGGESSMFFFPNESWLLHKSQTMVCECTVHGINRI